MDPLLHYIEHGAREGRKPHPLFDGGWYLSQNSAVAARHLNPLLHYIHFGASEGCDPHPLFDTKWYLAQLPGTARLERNPLHHYLVYGACARFDPHPLFDTAWYLAENPDVAAAGLNPLVHYIRVGAIIGRDPHPLFDSDWYLEQNADVAVQRINPLQHYVSAGALEGRDPNPHFDTDWYWARYPDSGEQQGNALLDYINEGARRNRDPHPAFWSAWYLSTNPSVAPSGINPLAHYITHGISQGRRPNGRLEQNDDTSLAMLHHEPWRPPAGPEWKASFLHRLNRRMSSLQDMNVSRPLARDCLTFSITTTAYNTEPAFLFELARTIRDQAFIDFEWLILDNGSTEAATVAALKNIASTDDRVRLFRVDRNIHIVGGNRYLLERANGEYIVPVDSDDILYNDSLALFANILRDCPEDLPCLLFSDEHRITETGEPFDLLWRWEFTFAHAMATVPAAHLMAFSAKCGRQAEVYTDEETRGSHDWDTLLRITEFGGRVVHVPEVLYGWRMHSASTAGSLASKSYVRDSQERVLSASLNRRKLDKVFSIQNLFGGAGWYQPKRKSADLPAIEMLLVLGSAEGEIQNLGSNLAVCCSVSGRRIVLALASQADELRSLRKEYAGFEIDWIVCESDSEILARVNLENRQIFARVIIRSNLRVRDAQGILDAVGVLELDPNAATVCGPVISDGGVLLSNGLTEGVGRFVASPFYGWPKGHAPKSLWRVMRRVSAAPNFFLAIRAEVVSRIGGFSGLDVDDAVHGLDFSLRCRQTGCTIVYSPSFVSYRQRPTLRNVGENIPFEVGRELETMLKELGNERFSPHLSRIHERFGFLATADELDARGQDT